MSTETFSLKDYSLPPAALIPADEDLDHAANDAAYARDCRTLDTDSLMLLVAERFSDSDALRALVEDTKHSPFTPGERRALHVSDAMRAGDALAAILADVMDEQVEMRLAATGGQERGLLQILDKIRAILLMQEGPR